MKPLLLGEVIEIAKGGDILGISNRAQIINYVRRAVEELSYKANWDLSLAEMDVCISNNSIVLPSEIGTPLAVNTNGQVGYFRNSWFEYHVNGPGSNSSSGTGCAYAWDDKGETPVFQQISDFRMFVATSDDASDVGKYVRVFGMTEDDYGNSKEIQSTNPATGLKDWGIWIPITLQGTTINAASVNTNQIKLITRVIKVATTGFVKLTAVNTNATTNAVVVGYYRPDETDPKYRKLKVAVASGWARIKYRRSSVTLTNDWDVLPIPHLECMINMLKAIRLRETNNVDIAMNYAQIAFGLFNEYQEATHPNTFSLQVDPSFGVGTIDLR